MAGIRLACALLGIVVLGGCGGGEGGGEVETEVPGGAPEADVRVIDAWATSLRVGDVDAAARLFALPSVAENGPVEVRIRELDDARLFNASLPCGAKLERATLEGRFVIATFRLTERPGAGVCGPGTGQSARTAFVIEAGKIIEWRRVAAGERRAPSRSI